MNDLAPKGFAVIPSILGDQECEKILDGFWDFFGNLTQEWEKPISRHTPDSWSGFYDLFPMHSMLFQHWGIGQSQFIWDVRQNPKIVKIFADLWNCKPEDLVVSFDGASFSMPPETTKRGWFRKTWFHSDQSYTRPAFECIQSWVTALDVREGDATLSVLEGSHLLHDDFAKRFGVKDKKDWYKLNEEQLAWYKEQCPERRITCPKGSLILWDSRTIHCGVEPLKSRVQPNMRAIVYLCYMPRRGMTPKMIEKKKKAFQEKRMTTHWPTKTKLFPKEPRTYGKPLPRIVSEEKDLELDPLGWKLAGF